MSLFSRRGFLTRSAGVGLMAAAGVVVADPSHAIGAPAMESAEISAIPGRLKQSLCRWPYTKISLPELCRRTKQMGFAAIDLLFPDEWSAAADAGLTVSMGYASRRDKFIATGFNDPANHTLLIGELEAALPLAAIPPASHQSARSPPSRECSSSVRRFGQKRTRRVSKVCGEK